MRYNRDLLDIYKGTPFLYRIYTAIRYAICPFEEIERHVPQEASILDGGCGHGIFANILAMKSDRRHVTGIDIDEDKIRVANSTLSDRKNIEFRVGSLEKYSDIDNIKCVTLIDVLHYVPLDKKKKLLKGLYDALEDEGVVIIKSIKEFPRWKYYCTLFYLVTIDRLMHRRFKGNTCFLEKQRYLNLLKDTGFEVEFRDIDKGYLFPHCLYVCTKNNRR